MLKISKYFSLAMGSLLLASPSLQAAVQSGKLDFEVYGFAQLDYIQDFKRVNPDWNATLRPSRIPTTEGQFGSDGQAILSVRQSRLGAQANIPTAAGDVFTKLEFDFYGVGGDAGQTTIRLRHAYGQFKQILGGQTNSLFMDGSIFPNTIDYWGPAGMVFLRNPQIRYTPLSGRDSFAVAIEAPSNDIDTDVSGGRETDIGTHGTQKIPDFTAQLRREQDWGHVQLAGILRRVSYETDGTPGNRPSGCDLGWGLDLTTNIKMTGKNTIHGGLVYGEGIASYMNDGGVDMGGKTDGTAVKGESVPLIGYMMYYDHYWNDKWSSSMGYSRTQVDNTDRQTSSAFHHGQYASINLIHYPTTNVFYGIEGLWGQRKDNGGAIGIDKRIQVSLNYKFSSKDVFKSAQ